MYILITSNVRKSSCKNYVKYDFFLPIWVGNIVAVDNAVLPCYGVQWYSMER